MQRHSFISSSQVTTMGNHCVSISVPDWVQVHQGPRKRWRTLQVAYSYWGSPGNTRANSRGPRCSYCRAAWKNPRQDPLLSKVRCFTKSGWPQDVKGCFKPYCNRRHKFSVEGDCVLWGIWVIVSKKLQNEVLTELHREHSQDGSSCKELCGGLVWTSVWKIANELPHVQVSEEYPSSNSTSSVDVAIKAMAKSTCWFHWTF